MRSVCRRAAVRAGRLIFRARMYRSFHFLYFHMLYLSAGKKMMVESCTPNHQGLSLLIAQQTWLLKMALSRQQKLDGKGFAAAARPRRVWVDKHKPALHQAFHLVIEDRPVQIQK